MVYGIEYFGFVYIWFDTKRKKYIIGSHYGSTEDGYKTSTGGSHVRRIFQKRPETMKRRILEFVSSNSYEDVLKAEQRWLDLRPNIATDNKYYNLKPYARGGIDKTVKRTKPPHWRIGHSQRQKELSLKGKHNFTSKFASQQALKRLENGSHHFINSDFNKKPFCLYENGVLIGKYQSKVEAVSTGIKANLIDSLRASPTGELVRPKSKKHYKYISI